MNGSLRTRIFAVISSLLLTGVAFAQTQTAKFAAGDTKTEDRFGWAIDVEGDLMVVGASQDFQPGGAGAAYVFFRSGGMWQQQATLLPPDPRPDDVFGGSVALHGNLIAVGATGDDTADGFNAGAVYVYERNDSGTPGNPADDTWPLQAMITADDAGPVDLLGISVDVRGDRILAGAWGESINGNLAGAAYLFRRVAGTWLQEAKLIASDTSAEDRFGVDVSLGDGRLVVGANGDTAFRGAAYVFEEAGDTWIETAKLAPAAAGVVQFGRRVALTGDVIVAGAGEENGGRGAAYVFRLIGGVWTQEARLVASEAIPNDRFGVSVALEGDLLAVGAQQFLTGKGAVYLFQRTAGLWSETKKVTADDGAPADVFGFSATMDKFQLAVGSPLHDAFAAPDGGAVYVFEVVTLAQQFEGLVDQIEGLPGLTGGQTNSLLAKINGALSKLDHGNTTAAINQLEALINEIEALARSGTISAQDAAEIIESVRALINRVNG